MKKNFKIQFIALLAIFSGSTGSAVAAQADGAFGAVRPAQAFQQPQRSLPPIVSSGSSYQPVSAASPQNNMPLPAGVSSIGQTAVDHSARGQQAASPGELPPIISNDQKLENRTQTQQRQPAWSDGSAAYDSFDVPPIVTPDQRRQAPITRATEDRQLPETLLAPIPDPNIARAYEDRAGQPQIVQADGIESYDDSTENQVQQTAQWSNQGSLYGGTRNVPIYQASGSYQGEVPIVQGSDASGALPPIVGGSDQQPMPPIVTGASQPRASQGLAPMAMPATESAQTAPPIIDSAPPVFSSVEPGMMQQSTMQPSIMQQPSYGPNVVEQFEITPRSTFDPAFSTNAAPGYFAAPPQEAPVIVPPSSGCTSCGTRIANGSSCSNCNTSGGCTSCNGGGCSDCGIANGGGVANCQSCGPNGCFNQNQVTDRFNACGSVSQARRYLIAEALYFDRADGTVANSNFGSLGNFDWNLGWRFTLGNRSDATRGRELTYFGTLPLEQTINRTDPLGRISARFGSADGFTGIETTAFRNGVEQNQFKETSIHSLEFNRVSWGWDVIKTFVGLRYIHVDDEYQMFSRNRFGEIGSFEMEARNNLIGPHIGGELFYDVGYRLSYSLVGKAGLYANFNRVDTRLINAGARFIDAEDDNGTVSGSLELGFVAHYQLNRRARLRAGYNVLWLGEVASVSDNVPAILTPTTGTGTSDSDDMLFHGLSFGLEIYR